LLKSLIAVPKHGVLLHGWSFGKDRTAPTVDAIKQWLIHNAVTSKVTLVWSYEVSIVQDIRF